jgi:hypothetical protein
VQDKFKEYEYDEGILYLRDKIYVPADEEVKQAILEVHHDSVMAGHPGQAKTLELVSRTYTWPSLKAYINRYVDGCDQCHRSKNFPKRPHGPLQPLEVPSGPWTSISYDLITGLPPVKGFNAILNVVDRLTKMAHFIPTSETVDALGVADLLLSHVWKHHGLPQDTISDRGPQFAAASLRALYERLGIKPKLSTAYHPQTDGQTERVNQNLEQFLRIYSSQRQDNWVDLLPLAEFSYNNATHASIDTSPFFANYGRHPTLTTVPSGSTLIPSVDLRVKQIEEAQKEIQSAMKLAQEKMKMFYDRYVGEIPKLNPGDEVWLDRKNIQTDRPSQKLDFRRLGPFKILEKMGPLTYKLQLPPSMRIHPVFHVSHLNPRKADTIPGRKQEQPPPVVVEGEEEYEVESILDSRKWGRGFQYFVKWKGYGPEHNEWVPKANVENAQKLVDLFHRINPQAPHPSAPPAQADRRRRA